MPGFGLSPENDRTRDMAELAATMAKAADGLGLAEFNLMGTSFGGKTALWLAVQQPDRVQALILEAPAAIRPEGSEPPSGSPEEMARRLYAHPERVAPLPPSDPAVRAKQTRLVARCARTRSAMPISKHDCPQSRSRRWFCSARSTGVIPPEMGHFYKELMPNAHLVYVYDAGHADQYRPTRGLHRGRRRFIERREAFVISRTETVIHP